jgi:1-hydroxy-2-naphthoate dioxygenase
MEARQADPKLAELEKQLAAYNLRGQWQMDANRPQNVRRGSNGAVTIDPMPAGKPHVWRWDELTPLLRASCEAMPESFTARRAMVLSNPGLARGTTHTLLASLQVIRAGETAWAHRHTINAIRFAIQGSAKLTTVVEGRALSMEPYDLILTPGGSWHDHHNESEHEAIWLDALDVPFTLALNQNFYDELGDMSQERTSGEVAFVSTARARGVANGAADRPYRYPWTEMLKAVALRAAEAPDPHAGCVVDYVDPRTGGSVLPTLSCSIQQFPPGFRGTSRRRTSSAMCFVIEGRGTLKLPDCELAWSKHDAIAVPNWTFHSWINASNDEPATLFTIADTPILDAFGYYREESES